MQSARPFDRSAVNLGFKDEHELQTLVAKVNVNGSKNMQRFTYWQENDGTNAGLEVLISWNKK